MAWMRSLLVWASLGALAACGPPSVRPTPPSPRPRVSVSALAPPPVAPLAEATTLFALGDVAAARRAFDRAARDGALVELEPTDPAAEELTVRWSADKKRVAVRRGARVRVFEVGSWREVSPRPIVVDAQVPGLAIDPSGALLAIPRDHDVLELWRVDTAKVEASFPKTVDQGPLEFSPDGALFAYAKMGTRSRGAVSAISLWDVRTRAPRLDLAYASDSSGRWRFLAGGARLRVDGYEGSTTWDVRSGAVIGRRGGGWTLDGPAGLGVYARWGTASTPTVVELETERELGTLNDARCAGQSEAVFGPRGQLATIAGGRVCVWDVGTRAVVSVVDVPMGGGARIALMASEHVHFTRDGEGLVVGVSTNADYPQERVLLFDARTGALVEDFGKVEVLNVEQPQNARRCERGCAPMDIWLHDATRHELIRVGGAQRERRALDVVADRFVLPTRSLGTKVKAEAAGLRVVDVASGQLRALSAEPGEWEVSASSDLRWMIGTRAEGDLRVWDLESWRPTLSGAPVPPTLAPMAMRFVSESALTIVTAQGTEARVELGAAVRVIAGPPLGAPPWSVAIAANGAALVASNDLIADGVRGPPTVAIPSLGKSIALLPPTASAGGRSSPAIVEDFVASDDATIGAAVVSPWDNTDARRVRVWDLASGRSLRVIDGMPWSVALDPRGKRVAVVNMDGLGVLDVATGKRLASFDAPAQYNLRFSADGARLVSVGTDGVHVWDIERRTPVCARPGELAAPFELSRNAQRLVATRGTSLVVIRADDCTVARTIELGAAPAALALQPSGVLVAVALSTGEVQLRRVDDGGLVMTVRIAPGAGVAMVGGGADLFGDPAVGARFVRCRAGGYTFPFDFCAERFARPGAVASALR
jgi:WD40 repeat protein